VVYTLFIYRYIDIDIYIYMQVPLASLIRVMFLMDPKKTHRIPKKQWKTLRIEGLPTYPRIGKIAGEWTGFFF